ncbi:MAG: tetraacyldisaccharide 4'-kinase [Candidatus Marinimicrobia bacterium]|nr:tetraacyldisaccharide 4'-kinase [Candidatus Neomarinimicrobiota bacterium]
MTFYQNILFPILIPLSWMYGLVIWVRNLLYDKGWIKSSNFNKPIISVGNITTGGTGKTPLVIYLAELLKKNGMNPGIISRGYGRTSQGMLLVHDGKKLLTDVESSGDEPYLMARVLENVPVVVCEDRSYGIQQLIDYYSVNVVIIDDGFQHRKVKRDLDIITISANDKREDYRLLPWGKLREPLQNLKRANAIIITKTNNFTPPNLHTEIQSIYKGSLYFSTIVPILMKYDSTGYHKSLPPSEPLFGFCGIGEPDSFIDSIGKLELKLSGKRIFRDHQEYTHTVITELSVQIKSSNCKAVITTEKDLVKLPDNFLTEFNIYVIKIEIRFKDEGAVLDLIQSVLRI